MEGRARVGPSIVEKEVRCTSECSVKNGVNGVYTALVERASLRGVVCCILVDFSCLLSYGKYGGHTQYFRVAGRVEPYGLHVVLGRFVEERSDMK